MATRSTIKVEGVDFVKIYQHWDGAPNDMLPMLESFNADFEKHRANDPEYKIAQLVARLADGYTGHGLMPIDAEVGAAYEYTLNLDGSVSYEDLY